MLNNRCSIILDIIINSDKPIMINELAEKFNVSSRTVRYDLDKIDDYLTEIGMPKLERKPNTGISLILSDEKLKKLFKLLGKINNYDYVLCQKERVMYMICELLSKNDFITINSLSEHLMVSRGTIINDISEMKKWLKENNIVFETSKGHGIKVSGDEAELRKAAIKSFFQGMDQLNSLNINIIKLFKDIDLDFIRNSIKTAEEQIEGTFSDDAFNSLVIHIAMAIKRIQLSKDIIMDKVELKSLSKTAEYAIASGIAKMLEERFSISVPEDEIGYITIHLLGSNLTSTKNNDKDDWVHIHLITSSLIEEVEKTTGYNFKFDSQLFDGLLQHIRPALYRLKHDLKVKNPMIKEIKSNYPDMFINVSKSAEFIEEDLRKKISEEEIGYLTLHFMASLERFKNKKFKRPNVLVVCATGIGTSKFVSTKLKTIFDISIINTISSHDVDKVLKDNDIDVIVTTIPMNIPGIKCIEVNPFLTEKNISDLSLYFAKLANKYREDTYKYEKNMFDNILDIINESCTITNYRRLKEKLARYFDISEITSENFRPALKELIDKNCIIINAEAETWEEAVRKSGELLRDNGYITDSYIEAMVTTVKNTGPYIVILPGIAMPHAKPEDGALKIGFSFLTLKEPVIFGNEENDPVRLIIAISAIDNLSHMNALKDLMKIIEQDNFLQNIMEIENSEELLTLLTQN